MHVERKNGRPHGLLRRLRFEPLENRRLLAVDACAGVSAADREWAGHAAEISQADEDEHTCREHDQRSDSEEDDGPASATVSSDDHSADVMDDGDLARLHDAALAAPSDDQTSAAGWFEADRLQSTDLSANGESSSKKHDSDEVVDPNMADWALMES